MSVRIRRSGKQVNFRLTGRDFEKAFGPVIEKGPGPKGITFADAIIGPVWEKAGHDAGDIKVNVKKRISRK